MRLDEVGGCLRATEQPFVVENPIKLADVPANQKHKTVSRVRIPTACTIEDLPYRALCVSLVHVSEIKGVNNQLRCKFRGNSFNGTERINNSQALVVTLSLSFL